MRRSSAWLAAFAFALVPAALGSPPAAWAQEAEEIARVPGAPDFSEVTTQDDIDALVEQGKLEPVLLFPEEVGGPNIPPNTVYVTPEAATAKRQIDQTIERFANEGLIDDLSVSPSYRGDSLIPARISVIATHSQNEGGLDINIEVW